MMDKEKARSGREESADNLEEFDIYKPNFGTFIVVRENPNDQYGYDCSKVQYRISVYRHPISIFFSVFLPMAVLGLFIVLSFYIEDFVTAIATIATFLIAYVAFIPTVRELIPAVSYLTIMDFTILSYFVACLTSLGAHTDNDTDTVFWMCLSIGIMSAPNVVVFFLLLKHYITKHTFKLDLSD